MPPASILLHPSPQRQARPALRAAGRFMLGDGIEHRCQTMEITPSGVALRASVRARLGEHVICYLERYGRVEGRIARLFEDGFAVDFSAPQAKRDKLAQQLALQAHAAAAADLDLRQHERIEPTRKRVVLRIADGRHIAAQVINLSRSGAALTCPVALALGEAVSVGSRAAHVARVTQRLLAVAFASEIAAAEFTPDIVL